MTITRLNRLNHLFVTTILFGGLTLAAAQPEPTDASRRGGPGGSFTLPARLSVSGTGEIRVAPDMAVITVEATFTRGTPREAAAEVRKAMDAALVHIRKAVKDSADLRTARISLNPQYDWNDGKRVFRGYAASQTLEVTVRDLGKIEALLGDLFKTPVTGLNGPEFRHSKADSLQREAGALAVRDAAANAAVLCAAAGKTCDDLVSLRAGGAGDPQFPVAEFKAVRMSADAAGSMPVQPGTLTFTASVQADYRMK